MEKENDRIGENIEKFKLLKLLGKGGMGQVFLAEHIYTKRRVALKVLDSKLVDNNVVFARFQKEAQAAAVIGHPNIVQIIDFGKDTEGNPFIAMELLNGDDLSNFVNKNGLLSIPLATYIISEVLDTISVAHKNGVIHRDLKPENIFIHYTSTHTWPSVKILDFGISKFTLDDGSGGLTKTGSILGTPYYMSFEQASGEKVDSRTDIYSIGVILYQLLTGVIPFKKSTLGAIILAIAEANVTSPSSLRSEIPPVLNGIILNAMAKNRDERFQTCDEFKDSLQQFHQNYSVEELFAHPSSKGIMPSPQMVQGDTAGPGYKNPAHINGISFPAQHKNISPSTPSIASPPAPPVEEVPPPAPITKSIVNTSETATPDASTAGMESSLVRPQITGTGAVTGAVTGAGTGAVTGHSKLFYFFTLILACAIGGGGFYYFYDKSQKSKKINNTNKKNSKKITLGQELAKSNGVNKESSDSSSKNKGTEKEWDGLSNAELDKKIRHFASYNMNKPAELKKTIGSMKRLCSSGKDSACGMAAFILFRQGKTDEAKKWNNKAKNKNNTFVKIADNILKSASNYPSISTVDPAKLTNQPKGDFTGSNYTRMSSGILAPNSIVKPQMLNQLVRLCNSGQFTTCNSLGIFYEWGLVKGKKADFNTASLYYNMACSGGVKKACLLGGNINLLMYIKNKGNLKAKINAKIMLKFACKAKLQAGCTNYKLYFGKIDDNGI